MRSKLIPRVVAAAALLYTGAASAGAITFTGFVEHDFSDNKTIDPSVNVIPRSNDPFHLGQPAWMTNQGWVSGWSIKDIRTAYDPKTDTMYVGVNTFSVAGNVDGNGTPGIPDPRLTAVGGEDPAKMGQDSPNSDKSITVAFAPVSPTNANAPGAPVIVAGVPADKSKQGPGLDGFTVAAYKETGNGIQLDYGQTLPSHLGNLAFDPSLAHPGFEFSIANFTKGTGFDPTQAFFLSVYAGSARGIVGSKDGVAWTKVPAFGPQTPEPATILAWTTVLGAAAAIKRWRRSPASAQV